mmetsp:Transcript_19185/g.72488  ORF Transcript_19185/g.72488 Transcript_19185/m.72488 type:complete len:242 (-) Transcript_19185:1472-2197(-)
MQAQAFQEAQLQQVIGQAVAASVAAQEKALDAALEEMGTDEGLAAIRRRRVAELKKKEDERRRNLALGHGSYQELADQQQFFDAAKQSDRMLVHFYRGATRLCDIVHRRMSDLAPKHLEARFCKIDAEKSPFLCERLNIFMMPTIVLIKDGQTVHQVRGFDELGGTEEWPQAMLAWLASQFGVLDFEGERPLLPGEDEAQARKRQGERVGSRGIRDGAHEGDGDEYGESDAELDDMMTGFE